MSCKCEGNRGPGTCVKCGRIAPADPLPTELVNDFFDHLRETLEGAGKVHRPSPGEPEDPRFEWFERRCKERLIKGAETYGNRNFLKGSVDLPEEFFQEMLDGGNYVLMELTKSQPDHCAKVPLGMAAFHAFMAAMCMLEYQAKLRGSF